MSIPRAFQVCLAFCKMHGNQRIREILANAARELNSSTSWPIDIQSVLRAAGVRLEITNFTDKPLAAHLAISERPLVVINTKRFEDPFHNSFHRFSIAMTNASVFVVGGC